MLNIKSFYFNPFGSCCIVAWDESMKAVIVDPGCYTDDEISQLEDFIASRDLHPVYVLLTHAHFDHIFGVSAVAAKYRVPVVMDAKDRVIIENNKWFCMNFGLRVPDNSFAEGEWKPYAGTDHIASVLTIVDGDVICWGEDRRWEVLSTPGHTPGGVSFLDREAKLLVGGDTLFAGSIGRTDNKWGDYDALIKGIFEKLMVLDGDITVIPGHGGPTTIADERTKNPFLQPFNEEYLDPDDEN
ncbi:MAG: MBL fold metallo-hydrolase, partial [Bacteroidales bacterium]|nr:MBL fold metallo-hydrolase [Bacteroidales bacterium]